MLMFVTPTKIANVHFQRIESCQQAQVPLEKVVYVPLIPLSKIVGGICFPCGAAHSHTIFI